MLLQIVLLDHDGIRGIKETGLYATDDDANETNNTDTNDVEEEAEEDNVRNSNHSSSASGSGNSNGNGGKNMRKIKNGKPGPDTGAQVVELNKTFLGKRCILKMGQTQPLFVYFRSFHMANIAQIL